MSVSLAVASVTFSGDSTSISSRYFVVPKSTKTVFNEASAPTGWSQDTSTNNTTLRVVNSSAGSTVNTNRVSFSTVYTTRTFTVASSGGSVAGLTVGNTTLARSQLPQHTHGYYGAGNNNVGAGAKGLNTDLPMSSPGSNGTGGAGGGGSHNHPVIGSSLSASSTTNLDFTVKYVSCIACTLS